jgi:hypothetical protein
MCPIPNGFRDRAIWMQTTKLLIRKRYLEYVLFLIPVFIVQVTELVQFIINVRKFHIFTCFRQWRSMAGGKDNTERSSQTTILSNGSISETVRNRTHVHIKFLFRMTDIMTSQNIDLSSWDTLYIYWRLCQWTLYRLMPVPVVHIYPMTAVPVARVSINGCVSILCIHWLLYQWIIYEPFSVLVVRVATNAFYNGPCIHQLLWQYSLNPLMPLQTAR